MGDPNIQDALFKAGLIGKQEAEEAKKEIQAEKDRQEKFKRQKEKAKRLTCYQIDRDYELKINAINRIGKPCTYIEWILSDNLPEDYWKRCSFCGRLGFNANEFVEAEKRRPTIPKTISMLFRFIVYTIAGRFLSLIYQEDVEFLLFEIEIPELRKQFKKKGLRCPLCSDYEIYE